MGWRWREERLVEGMERGRGRSTTWWGSVSTGWVAVGAGAIAFAIAGLLPVSLHQVGNWHLSEK